MKISTDTFPFYQECVNKFGVDINKNVVFTYGDTIHARCYVSGDLFVHEQTHSIQQELMGKDRWWRRYIDEPTFRLSQELEAYRKQYKFFVKHCKDRNLVAKFLFKIGTDLSGQTYGNLISQSEAITLIKK